LLYLRAEYLYEIDRFTESRQCLERLLACAQPWQYRAGIPGNIKEKLAPRKLADILRIERRYAEAESRLLALLERYPDDTLTWTALGRVYVDSCQRAKLSWSTAQLAACPQGHIFATLLWASLHLTQNELPAAGAFIDQLIAAAPRMPYARILRSEWLARTAAPLQERIQACRDILRLQPGNIEAQRLLSRLCAPQARPVTFSASWGSPIIAGEGISSVSP